MIKFKYVKFLKNLFGFEPTESCTANLKSSNLRDHKRMSNKNALNDLMMTMMMMRMMMMMKVE